LIAVLKDALSKLPAGVTPPGPGSPSDATATSGAAAPEGPATTP